MTYAGTIDGDAASVEFSIVDGDEATIEPGNSQRLLLRAEPIALGSASVVLVITTNASNVLDGAVAVAVVAEAIQ